MKEFKPVSQSLGKPLSFGSFSAKQLVIFGTIFTFSFLLISLVSLVVNLSIFTGLYISAWIASTLAILAGVHPYKYFSKIYPPVPNWTKGHVPYSSLSKVRLGVRRLK